MSLSEIREMYSLKKFACDSCGKDLEECNLSLEDHMIHLINPLVLWKCKSCLSRSIKQNKIIQVTDNSNNPYQWQLQNK